ncbi:hypothetical protein AX15_006980 [Amanita polypyramis BW_CC]|nr:hypothetical protein AX15_006980 [Amanita polypyramis BW_CC]
MRLPLDMTAHKGTVHQHSTPPDDARPHEPPPVYTPYEAEYFVAGNGDVVSHDDHLNTDGEALYRFLLAQSLRAPYYQLHCRGTRIETRFHDVTRQNSNGQSETSREQYTDTVTDFDFLIDIYPSLPTSTDPQTNTCGPIHWSVADSDPSYRGRMVREYDKSLIGGKRVANRKERKEYNAWRSERITRGLPPWITTSHWQTLSDNPIYDRNDTVMLKSSKSPRQWADEYCASPKCLKEFMYEKVLYGWDIGRLEEAIRARIYSAPYNGSVDISFDIKNSKVYVRPNNRLSRILSNKWLKLLSILLLIFPFVWLFKRFHSRGGGRWEVCGAAYALKRTIREGDLDLPYSSRERPSNVIGIKEGEWFRKWQGAIGRAVAGRYQSSTPIPFSDAGDLTYLVGYLDDF